MIYSEEQKDLPPLFRAVGCLCQVGNKILLLKRLSDKSHPFHWGIPGGKVASGESRDRAMIRELFEETGLLQSMDNLEFVRQYFVVSEEVSFEYGVYRCTLQSEPRIAIDENEHSAYVWLGLKDALRLQLIPDLDSCLTDIFQEIEAPTDQLELFPKSITPPRELEDNRHLDVREDSAWHHLHRQASWFIAFGPPCAGKSTGLKALTKTNPTYSYVYDDTILKRHSQLNFYLRKSFMEQEWSYLFHFQLEVLPLRFWQNHKAPRFALIDESILSTLAYSRALLKMRWLTRDEYRIFHRNFVVHFLSLPKPERVYYFHCGLETALKRLERRGRIIEQYYPEEYLVALYESFEETSAELVEEYGQNVERIDTDAYSVKDIVRLHGPTLTKSPGQ